jgi:hypothetical protein
LSGFAPLLVLLASLIVTLPAGLVLWAGVSQIVLLIWWMYVYRVVDESPLWALLSPLGAAATFYIFVRAVLRGRRVSWKGRDYDTRTITSSG